MSEMIERVARAIDEASQPPGQKDYKVLMKNAARAAIEAMREPTMDMESAASNWQGAQMTYSDVWRAMIDAALK